MVNLLSRSDSSETKRSSCGHRTATWASIALVLPTLLPLGLKDIPLSQTLLETKAKLHHEFHGQDWTRMDKEAMAIANEDLAATNPSLFHRTPGFSWCRAQPVHMKTIGLTQRRWIPWAPGSQT